MKYPRTYHLPWSPGATSDDKILKPGWFENYKGKEVVMTEKLDGSNSCLTSDGVYARSHANVSNNPWDNVLWEIHSTVRYFIGANEQVFGENMYAIHSINYDKLDSYFYVFALCGMNSKLTPEAFWHSWDDVEEMANILNVPTVPVIWRGSFDSENEVKIKIDEIMKQPSAFGKEKEGIVMRIANEFVFDDFSKYVAKWVRPNHVTTSQHWTKNWKKAKLVAKQ